MKLHKKPVICKEKQYTRMWLLQWWDANGVYCWTTHHTWQDAVRRLQFEYAQGNVS